MTDKIPLIALLNFKIGTMDDLYANSLEYMEETVHLLAQRVPQPVKVPYKDGFVYRHIEKNLHQALVQKSSRIVSTLHAAHLLMKHGFVQEQASLQRILDELNEDVCFLSFSVIFNENTSRHKEYLDAFFEEEFDADSALESTQKRAMVRRKHIRAYIAKIENMHFGLNQGQEAARTVSKTYSGYIHAASPQIMDMYGGIPPRFQVRGMKDTIRHLEHRADLWNYFYRSIISFSFIAKAFGDEDLFAKIHHFHGEFERVSGKNYQSKEWEGI